MKSIYYIEIKSYYVDANGLDLQTADGGQIPILYTNKNKALTRVERMTNYWVETFGFQITIPNETNPARKGDCLYAVRLEKDNPYTRQEIRLYSVLTHD